MKKIFLILSVALASVAVADDYAYLRELVELKKQVEQRREFAEYSNFAKFEMQKREFAEYSNFAKFEIEKMFVNNPKIFNSEFECFPHTFIWYKWKEYDKASNIGKLEILREIETLTKE